MRKKKESQSAVSIQDQQTSDLILYSQAKILFCTKISFALMRFNAILHVFQMEVFKVPFNVWKWSLISTNKSALSGVLDHRVNSWNRQAQQ